MTYLKPLIEALIDKCYIDHKKGYKYGNEDGKISRIWPLDKFIDLLPNKLREQESVVIDKESEIIILKDKEKNLLDYNKLPNKTTQRIQGMRKVLKSYNRFMEKANITHPENPCIRRFLYRVFNNNSFKMGGRFYGAFWEEIKSKERLKIKINDNAVIELDYSLFHPSVLFNVKNLDFHKRCYEFNKFLKPDLIKVVVACLLNASSEKSAFLAINEKIRNEAIELPCGYTVKNVIEETIKQFSGIKDCFFKGVGLSLQYQDSLITSRILKHFTKKGIVVLPVHDSFIVESLHEKELHRLMVEEYKKEFRATFEPIIKKKEFGKYPIFLNKLTLESFPANDPDPSSSVGLAA